MYCTVYAVYVQFIPYISVQFFEPSGSGAAWSIDPDLPNNLWIKRTEIS